MGHLHSFSRPPAAPRRAAAVAVAMVVTLLVAPATWAQTTTTAASTTAPPTTEPATTTSTSGPPQVTSTTGTSTTAGTTTTVASQTGAPVTGIPQVPTGGPPTTPPAPGQTIPPPAPVDVQPSVDAVDSDLVQLAAISSYTQARAEVVATQAAVTAASGVLDAARADDRTVEGRRQLAADRLGRAEGSLGRLALAAYTGEAYAVPGSPDLSPDGTVSTIGGRSADAAAEAQILLGVVVEHTKRDVTVARSALAEADADDARAAASVAAAGAGLASASGAAGAARSALLVAAQAATAPQPAAEPSNPGTPPAGSATTAARRSGPQPPLTPPAGAHPGTTAPGEATAGEPTAPSVLGASVVTASELSSWYASTGHTAATTVPMAQLAADYLASGGQSGVRADLAYAQSIIETGFFSFPAGGQLTGTDNNFAGIGACDSCAHGWSFPDASTGVSAQMELLEAYASPTKVPTPLIGPVGVGGCCTTWTALAGTWASSETYGVEIMTIYSQILGWVIPARLAAAGLVPGPTTTTATAAAPPSP